MRKLHFMDTDDSSSERRKYRDQRTQDFADGKRIKAFQAFERQAYKRLEILEAAPNKEALCDCRAITLKR